MARVFQATFVNRKGQLQTARPWYVEFKDHKNGTRRMPTFAERRAAESFGRYVERLVELRIAGEPFDLEIRRWLDSLPSKLLNRLFAIELHDRERAANIKSLTDHVADFKKSLFDGGATPAYVQKTANRVTKAIDGIGAEFVFQLKAEKVSGFMAKQREGKKGLSAKSSNHYLAACKQFGNWLVKNKRAIENPLTHLTALNSRADRRHVRRTFEPNELTAILEAARNGSMFTFWRIEKDDQGRARKVATEISGEERYWLYRLAVETGLRSNELRQLRRADFDLDSPQPTVAVGAEVAKNRTAATLPLRPETANGLKAFMADKHPAATVFKLPRPENVVVMLRKDLKSARIPYEDDLGRVCDFHAFRVTFASMLLRSGVDLRTAKELMRHATVGMTADVYAVTFRGSLHQAIAKLPNLSQSSDEQKLKAVGTYDANPNSTSNVLSDCLARQCSKPIKSIQRDSTEATAIDLEDRFGTLDSNENYDDLHRTVLNNSELALTSSQPPPRGVEPLSSG